MSSRKRVPHSLISHPSDIAKLRREVTAEEYAGVNVKPLPRRKRRGKWAYVNSGGTSHRKLLQLVGDLNRKGIDKLSSGLKHNGSVPSETDEGLSGRVFPPRVLLIKLDRLRISSSHIFMSFRLVWNLQAWTLRLMLSFLLPFMVLGYKEMGAGRSGLGRSRTI